MGPAGGEFPCGEFAEGCPGAERFDAADFSECFGAGFAESGVADFQTFSAGAAIDLAVENDACAEAGAAREVDQAGFSDAPAPAMLGETTGGGIVLDSGRKTQDDAGGYSFDSGIRSQPGEVGGRQNDAALGVEGAADGDADGDDMRMVWRSVRSGVGAKIIDHWSGPRADLGWPLGIRGRIRPSLWPTMAAHLVPPMSRPRNRSSLMCISQRAGTSA